MFAVPCGGHKLLEKENIVQFGPEPKNNFIMNVESSKKIVMQRKGRLFVIETNSSSRVLPWDPGERN